MGQVTEVNNLIFLISIVCLLPLSIRLGKGMLAGEMRLFKEGLRKKEDRLAGPSGRLEKIRHKKAYLEEKLADLSRLYTITKEMSFVLRFAGLFKLLKSFLTENFRFEKFKIVLFKDDDSKRSVDRVYGINAASEGYVELGDVLGGIAGSAAKSKRHIFLERHEDLFSFGFPPNVKNILAIPLVARREAISVILIENTNPDERDKFLILAPQVAMQIERISLFDDVEKLSITDGLTGTFLRRYFLLRFKEEVVRAKECNMNISFIMADLDNFKNTNDRFGHLVGDVVLKEIAGILKANVREIDLVARFGGEEFGILLPEADKAGTHAVAERIRKAVAEHTIKAYDESLRITVSMGVSSCPEDSKGLDELIENADKALYEAKRQGRNRVCLAA
ncbi:MAG: GGDEF domain-containing protein [Candidatus Omnitrophota bacterium]